MKKILLMICFITAVLLLTPLPKLGRPEATATGLTAVAITDDLQAEAPAAEAAASESFKLKISETGEIITLSAEDYICGVLCGEMPSGFTDEALKAQAVAAYTFACRRKRTNSLKNYDITDDFSVDQCYISPEKARNKFGDSAEEILERFQTIVKDVSGYMITYNGTAALTVYHAVSSGKTQAASDVWGGSLPYLISVDSPGDTATSEYISTVTYSADETAERLGKFVNASGDPESWFGNSVRNSADYVTEISVCGKKITGAELRFAMELRSSCFEISFSDNSFIFTVRGNGHGVGMSQNGAEAMARQGSGYKEILYHYYPGCNVEKIEK